MLFLSRTTLSVVPPGCRAKGIQKRATRSAFQSPALDKMCDMRNNSLGVSGNIALVLEASTKSATWAVGTRNTFAVGRTLLLVFWRSLVFIYQGNHF
ncbi:MAG: hypothetical protein V2G42_04280 [bacterium JZ-2024 1]